MKACLQSKPMYCSREYNFTSRFNQQYGKSTSNEWHVCMCKTQWYIMGKLIIIALGMLYLVTNKIRKLSLIKGHLFSNNTKILLFVSNTHSYIPIKLCRVAGSIHLFRIRGKLTPEKVKLKKNWILDVLEIDWSNISITLNENEIDLPSSVIIPFKERYRARRLLRKHLLLYYVMLKQGKTWFSLVPKPRNLSVTNDDNWIQTQK